MFLKPHTTTLNPPALVYKRYTAIETSLTAQRVYYTLEDQKSWLFDGEAGKFYEVTATPNAQKIFVQNYSTILTYNGRKYHYTGIDWADATGTQYGTLDKMFNNIGKYQTNKYYYVGRFDYVIKGAVEGTTTQFIKGNITPLTSLNIKYFSDDIDLQVDDLVVIDGHLFSVENPETNIKYQPKPFKVHFATLNSIL